MPLIEDRWQQQEFENHVASILVSLYETGIKKESRTHPIKPARLLDTHLVQARVLGPYIPSKDRVAWPHTVDLMNDLLPKTACISLEGTPQEHYRHMSLVQQLRELPPGISLLNPPYYRVSYFMFPKQGKTEGFSAYFDVDPNGQVRLSPMGNFTWEDNASTKETLSMIAQVLQTEADRRFCWQIEAKEKQAHAYLGCQVEQIKSLLYARSLPLTATGRKRPILHLVEAHRRRIKNGIDVDVSAFLRGVPEIEMGGALFRVHAPAVLGLPPR